jgi:hypothetical protein
MAIVTPAHAEAARSQPAMAIAATMAAIIAAVLACLPQTARAQQLPSIDIQETCRAAAAVMVNLMGGSTTQNDIAICLESENKARQQMLKDWSTFQASDRAGCVQAEQYLPSYTEWLTCFEMNKVVREAKQQGRAMSPLTNPDGSFTMPKVRWSGRY